MTFFILFDETGPISAEGTLGAVWKPDVELSTVVRGIKM